MNILVHRDVILEGLTENQTELDKALFFNRAKDHPELKIWVCADSVSALAELVYTTMSETDARDLLDHFCRLATVLPLRQDDILAGIDKEGQSLESGVLIGMAARYKIPVLVVPQEDVDCKIDGVGVLSVDRFWQQVGTLPINEKKIRVPFLDLHAQLHQIYNPIDARFTDIIANTGYILGPHVKEFEEGFAHLQDANHCLGVSNGTAALHIALKVLGIGPGDRVIVPVNTFIATAEAVTLTGAEPVFIDCDQSSNIDVNACRSYLKTLKTSGEAIPKAIIPVHLYGQMADMDALAGIAQEYGLDIVEDACQAHLATWAGKKAGHWGRFTAFSFYPGKNLGAFGEGGALITNDASLYEDALLYRQHGEKQRYFHHVAGHNYRLEAFQGAVLAEKLAHIENWTQLRKSHAKAYNEHLSEVPQIEIPYIRAEADCVYHLYVIHTQQRDALKEHLEQGGVSCGLHYPTPLHLQPAYAGLNRNLNFPVAERAAARLLSLPLYPEMSTSQIEYVCRLIKAFAE